MCPGEKIPRLRQRVKTFMKVLMIFQKIPERFLSPAPGLSVRRVAGVRLSPPGKTKLQASQPPRIKGGGNEVEGGNYGS